MSQINSRPKILLYFHLDIHYTHIGINRSNRYLLTENVSCLCNRPWHANYLPWWLTMELTRNWLDHNHFHFFFVFQESFVRRTRSSCVTYKYYALFKRNDIYGIWNKEINRTHKMPKQYHIYLNQLHNNRFLNCCKAFVVSYVKPPLRNGMKSVLILCFPSSFSIADLIFSSFFFVLFPWNI